MSFASKPAQTNPAGAPVDPSRGGGRTAKTLAPALAAFALTGLPVSAAHAAGTVNVLYAGSLQNLMEHTLGPAFDKASGFHFRGYAGGSKLLANEIKGKQRRADVFISAVPSVNKSLMGSANGDWVSWYVSFAQSPLVIGYNRKSRFAADFKSKSWCRALTEPGIRIGRTDPKLDPKGGLTIALLKQAGNYCKIPSFFNKVVGKPVNSSEVLPEEVLVGRLQSGQLDAGFFYSTETSDAKIPAVRLPAQIAPKAVYTVAIPRRAADPAGAERFAAFLLGPNGGRLMKEHGLTLRKPALTGKAGDAPPAVAAVLDRRK